MLLCNRKRGWAREGQTNLDCKKWQTSEKEGGFSLILLCNISEATQVLPRLYISMIFLDCTQTCFALDLPAPPPPRPAPPRAHNQHDPALMQDSTSTQLTSNAQQALRPDIRDGQDSRVRQGRGRNQSPSTPGRGGALTQPSPLNIDK